MADAGPETSGRVLRRSAHRYRSAAVDGIDCRADRTNAEECHRFQRQQTRDTRERCDHYSASVHQRRRSDPGRSDGRALHRTGEIMYLAYSLLLSLGLLLFSPYFLFQALAHRKYIDGLRERLGFVSPLDKQPVIWLHCVSVGETQAARPLVERLRREWPHHALVVSTVTLTGQKVARDLFRSQAARVFYFPFDWRWTVRRVLRVVNPAVVLVMETELWPNFLRECKEREIPVAVVNGRISRKSFARYRRIRFFLRRVLEDVTIAVMQSEKDAERIRVLGMSTQSVFTAGNLKFESGSYTDQNTDVKTRFGLQREPPLVLAASTHAPEEKIVLESFKKLRQAQSARLMIAPRKPERFAEVAALVEASGLSWARRTNAPQSSDAQAEVILLD